MLSRISSSSSIISTEPFRLDMYSFPNHWQLELEGSSLSDFALYRNISSVLLHDAIADRQAKTCALADCFRGEERIIDLLNMFSTNADAGVSNADFDFRVGRLRQNLQLSTVRHRVA